MPNAGPDVKQLVDAFRELDINIGNGLIGDAQLQDPAKRALFIGLGGTGNHALRRLKRIISQRYRNIEQNFAFLGIDADTADPAEKSDSTVKDYLLLTPEEKVLLTASEDYFAPGKRDLMPDYIKEWLHEDAAYAVRGDGAGGKRAVARGLLFNSAQPVITKIENTIQRIRRGDDNARVEVFILAGIGGGTGSGTLLDIAYMLRHMMGSFSHIIHAFIFMPDINTSLPLPAGTKEYIQANSFGAIKEIDYWMSIKGRGDVYRQRYTGGFSVECYEAPFDNCWPLTAVNAAGKVVEDAINTASTVAAETICAWIAIKEGGSEKNSFLKSFNSNVDQCRDIYYQDLITKRQGSSFPVTFDYKVCGASIAKLPIAAINTYLACIVFSRFSRLYDRAFDEQIAEELPKFCAKQPHDIEFKNIKAALESRYAAQGLRTPDLSGRTWQNLFESDAERDFVYNLSKVAEVAEAVKAAVISDKMNNLNMAFRELFTDTKHGPYYLNSFIQNGSSGLIALLENFKRSAANEKSRLENYETDLEREKNEAHRNGKKAMFLTRDNHVKQYSNALARYYSCMRDKILCDAVMDVYTEIQEQLQRRINALYKATYGVLDALSDTFRRNINTFGSAVKVEQKRDTAEYSWDIFSLPDVVRLVQDTLNEHGIDEDAQDAIITDLLTDLLNLIEAELKRYESVSNMNEVTLQGLDINRFLANFITEKFKYLTKRSMKEYLEAVAKQKGKTLKEYLVEQFRRMETDSSPLFHAPPGEASMLYYGAIPTEGLDEFQDAWDEYARGNEHREAYKSENDYTLVFMTFACGVPLYEAKQLETAEAMYIKTLDNPKMTPYLQLVRSTSLSRKNGQKDEYWDWLNMPSPVPSDARPNNSLRAKDRDYESTCKTDVKRLIEKKLLRPDRDKCLYTSLSGAALADIGNVVLSGEISESVPTPELKAYHKKLTELRSYLTGEAPVSNNLREKFGVFFEIDGERKVGSSTIKPGWDDELHDITAHYSRGLNIKRDLCETEKLYDMLSGKIGGIDKILKSVASSGKIAEQITKGFRCGVFKTNGKQWQYIDEEGEASTLARGMGADKYPLLKMYEGLMKLKDFDGILARVDNEFNKALDNDTLDEAGYKAFKAEFKKDSAKLQGDEDATEAQLFFMNRVGKFMAEME